MSMKFSDIFANSEFNVNNPVFEEMINKTRDVAQTVGKKSAEHLQYSRKKLELLDVKAKLSRLYEKFGRLKYDDYVGIKSDQEEIENTAMSISHLKEKIEILTAELDAMKESFKASSDNKSGLDASPDGTVKDDGKN